MDISITGRHINIDDATRSYAEEKFSKVQRFFQGIQTMEVVFKEEDRKIHCEAIIHLKNKGSVVIDVARDGITEAIDVAVSKVERQMRKAKEKRTSHRRTRDVNDAVGVGVDTDTGDEE